MKQPIPITGSIILIVFMSIITYLAVNTHILVPKEMKEKRNDPSANQYQEYPQNEQNQEDGPPILDYDSGEFEEYVPSEPLFDDEIDLSNWQVSKPANFKNLSICLIYGKTDLDRKKYVTLNNALSKNMVVVHETQDVNELRMDNKSDQYIYINSGEIVKGGQQDRTIQYDIVVAPHATNVDLASFCVEHGRWSQRGNEDMVAFRSSEKMVSNSDLKLATKHDKDQSKVWKEVETYQVTTENSVNACIEPDATPISVKDEQSESSLELTLENVEIEKLQQQYRLAILKQLENRKDITGFAYFINGKLYGIDVFNNHQLFADLFNKLLDASIAEAISVYDTKMKIPQVSNQNISLLLVANAKVYQDEEVNKETQFRTSQHNAAKNVLIFTSFDKKEKSWLHRNWLEDSGM